MPFQVKKISDYGTSNPFVARLGFQFNELMKFFRLSKDQQEKLFVEQDQNEGEGGTNHESKNQCESWKSQMGRLIPN